MRGWTWECGHSLACGDCVFLHVLTPRLVCSWVWYVLVVWLVGVKVMSVCCVALHV